MDKRGQALVEFAYVFPTMMLVFLVLMQLILFVTMKMRLTETTCERAAAASWGQSLPLVGIQKQPIARWKRYAGLNTLDAPGQWVTAWGVQYKFGHSLQARVSFMEEPVVPGEPN